MHDGRAFASSIEEPPIDPDLAIVDAHHHLWLDPPRPVFTPYPAECLAADIADSGHNVVATVYVECGSAYRTDGPEAMKPVGEVAFADAMASAVPRASQCCAAIVSYADLLSGDAVGEVLDAARETSSRFRGIRFKTAFDPELGPGYGGAESGLMKRPAFLAGAAQLARRGLTYDAWMFHPQLGELVALARALPDLVVILNHLGGPIGIGSYAKQPDETFNRWRTAMAELASCPNIVLKIGSLNMTYAGLGRAGEGSEAVAEAQRTHILTAIELFGPARCMFESNFPVERATISYGLLWNAFKRLSWHFSKDERHDLFAGTAARIYRIASL